MKKFILLSIILIQFGNSAKASHVFGAEISYICEGNKHFTVTYTFYRDCFGIAAPPTQTLNVTNTCGFADSTYSMPFLSSYELNFPCNLNSTCNGGVTLGIEKCMYRVSIVLPDTCQHWILSVNTGSRNPGLSIFDSPDIYNLYVEASINNSTYDCINSPVLNNDPIVLSCVNETYCMDPGVIDIDNDSISVSFIVPRSDANTNVPYKMGYSLFMPMALSSPLVIDNSNGIFCFNALSPIYTQYAIQVSAFRNGQLVSEVIRDIGLYVINCTGVQPEISGINGTISTDISVCANVQHCFNIGTTDGNINDSTNISWNAAIPSATFNIIPGQNESGIFCWTPGINDISFTPHCFSVNVKDNSCPVFQTNEKTFCITVVDSATCVLLQAKEISNSDSRLIVYPQPTVDILNVEFKNNNQHLNFYMTDFNGKKIFEKKIGANQNKILINTDFILPGMYIGYLKDENDVLISAKKIIITNSHRN